MAGGIGTLSLPWWRWMPRLVRQLQVGRLWVRISPAAPPASRGAAPTSTARARTSLQTSRGQARVRAQPRAAAAAASPQRRTSRRARWRARARACRAARARRRRERTRRAQPTGAAAAARPKARREPRAGWTAAGAAAQAGVGTRARGAASAAGPKENGLVVVPSCEVFLLCTCVHNQVTGIAIFGSGYISCNERVQTGITRWNCGRCCDCVIRLPLMHSRRFGYAMHALASGSFWIVC